ncbi:homospermidine synthase [Fodinicurvata halophila]|uniref:homospermidine synthase n=1 Tax=Fodinicurvata halophila TaxID=1419723 RepID=UPI003640ACB2
MLPLLRRHIGLAPEDIVIINPDPAPEPIAAEFDAAYITEGLTPDNFRDLLGRYLRSGDFLLNLSVDVSSVDLARYAHERGALYLDTCIEPWLGSYVDPDLTPSQRSNYALREDMLALRRELGEGPTATITHGANPGLVNHFVKVALTNIARDLGQPLPSGDGKDDWSGLARDLNVTTIHIAERDTQRSQTPKNVDEFINTWSIDGFYSEGLQPAELGWGTHEKALPPDGARHDFGADAAIYLNRPGASTRVRTWTPEAGPIHGFLITHNESISLPDYLTHRQDGQVVYRPTVHYAYHPCDSAVLSLHELAGRNWEMQSRKRLIVDEVVDGMDELGVLLAGHGKNAYWYGSQLSIEEARRLAPHNNATSLQVTVAVLAGLVWAIENPRAGIVEPEEMDHERIMEIAAPYLGRLTGAYTDWSPLTARGELFAEDVDREDPWQFRNVRVV